jgi:imidazolonepropionase-like amidohydrolase
MTNAKQFLAGLLVSSALMGSAAFAETIAITNAKIETVGRLGTIAKGTLIITDSKITALGANVVIPANARIVDAKGGVVTPGLIASSSSLAAAEIEQVMQTRDDRSGALSSGFDIQYSINPQSPLIPLARQSGLTRAVATPVLTRSPGGHADDHGAYDGAGGGGGGEGDPSLFAGQAAIVRLASKDTDLVERARVAVTLDLGEAGASAAGGSRGASLVLVRAALEDARAYSRNRAAYEDGGTREYGLSRVDLDALVPVVQGKTPLLIRVHSAPDIRQALRLAREEKLQIILEGAEEAWIVASAIAAAGVPVLIDAQASLPAAFESRGARLDNAARLQAAGVKFAIIGSRDFNNVRQARLDAGLAVAHGLPYQAALASLTANPASIWGMSDVGSLDVGKTADVVVWNGDPLETSSWPNAVFIKGVEQTASVRAFELRDRYASTSSNGYSPAYR